MKTPVMLVTGANKGIGRAIAHKLAKLGNHVILTSRNEQLGKQTLQEFQKEGLSNLDYHPLDVTSEKSVSELKEWLSKNYSSGIDVLINNAGWASKGPAIDEKIARTTLETNYFGLKRVTLALLPLIKDGGRIVNVSSSSGKLTEAYSKERKQQFLDPNLTLEELDKLANTFIQDVIDDKLKERGWPLSTYMVSKALVNSFTRIMDRDLKKEKKNITINAYNPGWCRTDMAGPKAPRTPEQGAECGVWLATAPKDEIKYSGRFFDQDCKLSDW